jgi:hypothetical protein
MMPTATDDSPPLCQNGNEPDRYKMFASLREMWKHMDEPLVLDGEECDRTYVNLARRLDTSKQAVAQWATGSGDKSPAPWHVIMTLCHDLGLGVAIEPSGAKLYRLNAAK